MLRRIVLLCWLCAGLPAALAQGLAVRDLAVLRDAAQSETIDSVTAAGQRFAPLPGMLSAGYTRDAHWLRFTVQVPTPGAWWLEIQPSFLDDVRLFEPLPGVGTPPQYRERRGGDLLPFEAKAVPYRAMVVPLQMADTQPRTFYLRLHTSGVSMVFLKLWQPLDFQQAKAAEYMQQGLFLGLMATVLAINLLYWFWLRDALHGAFALHVLMMTLLAFGANGFAAQFLFPDAPAATDIWVGFFLFAGFSAAALFYRLILNIGPERPRLYLIYRVMLVLPLLAMTSLIWDFYTEAARLMVVLMLPLVLVGLVLAYGIWRRGGRDGMAIMAGIGFTLAGSLPLSLMLLGALPGELWVLNIRQITVLGSIFAMHIAVATRMRANEAGRIAALERAQRAEQQAAEEMQVQGEHRQFIAMLTHELRTPLAVIDGAVQSLEYLQPPQDEETRLRFRRIRRAVGRINGLVKQFLAKDKIDDARLALRPLPQDGIELARQALRACVEGAERIRLVAPEALACRGDAALLQVALLNLFDNALKYSPPESEVECRVEAVERAGHPGVAWSVADRGSGIDPASWDEVFGKYVRGEGYGHVAGAGLGLYLVRRIAELHGGAVEILEREDWGAVLRLWLPQEAAA
ncbi:MAG: sensor histidine kinase [Rhodocyclales bacterium]|nr:sensor histidine kinase [Rhodocyclales bacterium]